ncbi:cytochrome P450 [Streptomyces sp. NPDC018000]|uniref:cytochrome P450 n=1 Tax=Streptomyces sp. NPDC018000 TaxID=3365028 RepID=UPI00378C4819
MGQALQPPRLPGVSAAAYRRDRLGTALRGARECGDVWQLRKGVYVAASADACEAVLRRTTYEYGTFPGTFPPSTRPDGSAPPAQESAHGHAARMRALRPRAVADRIGVIAPGAAAFAAGWPSGQEIDLLPYAKAALAGIGSRYLFCDDAEEMLAAGGGLGPARDAIVHGLPWPPWVPTPARRALRRNQTRFCQQLLGVMERRRREGRLGDDLLGQMLRPSSQYGVLADGAVLDGLTGLMVAVSEVPTRAVGWLLLALAQHPQAADRVAAEAAALPRDPHAVTGEHLAGLRFTEALVREVLRLHPPNWLLGRHAVHHTELAGYPVPAGTTVLVCPYTAHRDPREHPDPEEFRPERWLTASGTPATSVFLPFGTGPRSCEGSAMAMAELTLIAAETARLHHLHEPPGPGPHYALHTHSGLTPVGLRLRATPRRR